MEGTSMIDSSGRIHNVSYDSRRSRNMGKETCFYHLGN
jgi:hypothetical protein